MITAADDLSVLPWARSAYDNAIRLVQMLPAGPEREAAGQAAGLLSDVITGLWAQIEQPATPGDSHATP